MYANTERSERIKQADVFRSYMSSAHASLVEFQQRLNQVSRFH